MRHEIFLLVGMSVLSLGCGEEEPSLATGASATISGKGDAASLKGMASVQESGDNVKITVALSDVPADKRGTKLGVHIHAMGSCDDTDAGPAGAAGGHFNPSMAMHGDLNKGHAGDLGNIDIDSSGKGTLMVTSTVLKLGDGAFSVNDRAIVVHAMTDDLMTDPSGNSGARIGCGVLRSAR